MSSGSHHHHQQQQQQQHQQHLSSAELQLLPQQHPTDVMSHHPCLHQHHHLSHLMSHSPQHDRDPGHGLSAEDIQELLGGVLDDPNGCNPTTAASYGGGGDESAEEAAGGSSSGGVDANGIPLEAKAVARSERKRSREKQRRSDVNKQFADLTEVLRRIEAELHAAASEGSDHIGRGGDGSGGDGKVASAPLRLLTPSFSPTNRVDLIARTIQVLTSLEAVTKKQKTDIKRLAEDLEAAKQAGEETAAKLKEQMTAPVNMGSNRVMMMVPMMIGGDQPPQPMMHPMMNPFMQAAPGFMNNMMPNGGNTTDPTSSMAAVSPWMNPQAAWMMQAAMQQQQSGMATPLSMPGNNNSQQQQQNNNGSENNGKPSSRATTSGNLAHCA